MPMPWSTFHAAAFPERMRAAEASRSFVWRVNRYVGIRVAYLFFLAGFSANLLSLFRVPVAIVGFALFATLPDADSPLLPVLGLLLFMLQVHLDFADGAIARAQQKASEFGTVIDGLGNNASRFATFLLLGLFANNPWFLWGSVFAGYILTGFETETGNRLTPPGPLGRTVYRLAVSVIIVNIALPSALLGAGLLGADMELVGRLGTLFYGAVAIGWLVRCLREPPHTD